MSDFSLFMKGNKIVKEHEFYAATDSLRDKDGNPLMWELKCITSEENEMIKEECMDRENGFNTFKYMRKLTAECIVVPDLYNEKLQESYGVRTPEELLAAMVDCPGEYNRLVAFVQKMNGFDVSFDKKVKEAKN